MNIINRDNQNPAEDKSGRPLQAEEFFESVFNKDDNSKQSVVRLIPTDLSTGEASDLDYTTGLAAWRNYHMAAVNEARNLALDTIERQPAISDSTEIKEMLQRVASYYLNSDQYHNAEHMYLVCAYAVRLGEIGGLPQDESSIMTRVIAAAYHDSGNGQFPGTPGSDEVDAVEVFLRDARGEDISIILTADRTTPLQELSGKDRLQVIASIAGTVFRDRHASAEHLVQQGYVKDIADLVRTNGLESGITPDDIKEYAAELGLKADDSLLNLEEILAAGMVSKEALILKHADLSGSLSSAYAFKNHVTNRWEDQSKPHLANITDPQKYHDGFVSFVSGLFHDKADRNSPLWQEATGVGGTPSVFMGVDKPGDGGVADFGMRKLLETNRAANEIIKNHNDLLVHLHEMIKDENFNVPAQPLGILVDRLEERGLDLSSYPGLKNMPEALREKSFAAATVKELNEAFIPGTTVDYSAVEIELGAHPDSIQ